MWLLAKDSSREYFVPDTLVSRCKQLQAWREEGLGSVAVPFSSQTVERWLNGRSTAADSLDDALGCVLVRHCMFVRFALRTEQRALCE